MDYERGTIVRSLKGRNKGSLAVVMKSDEKFIYIADGKQYKTAQPKPKNRKHIEPVGLVLGQLYTEAYKKLRKELNKVKPNL